MNREPQSRRLGPLLRDFLGTYLPRHRGASVNTVHSYRDSWSLLLRFGREHGQLPAPDDWCVRHVDRRLILDFLTYLEAERKVSVRTRNCRLAAIHSFFRYLDGLHPDLHDHCRRILAVPSKRRRRTAVGHLELEELQTVLRSVRLEGPLDYRDLALLAFAYNTGARVHEIARAREAEIVRGTSPSIRILGKGNKEREVPLWTGTLRLLDDYRRRRPAPRDAYHAGHLFLGARGTALTRYHVGRIITRYIRLATLHHPAMLKKRLTAHSMRHTTAVHLLQSKADVATVKAWLGHASVESTMIYLDLDLTRKREVLEHIITSDFAEICLRGSDPAPADPGLLRWLESL